MPPDKSALRSTTKGRPPPLCATVTRHMRRASSEGMASRDLSGVEHQKGD